MAQVNWGSLSNSDLEAIANNQWSKVSEPGLKLVSGQEYGTLETLGRGFERGLDAELAREFAALRLLERLRVGAELRPGGPARAGCRRGGVRPRLVHRQIDRGLDIGRATCVERADSPASDLVGRAFDAMFVIAGGVATVHGTKCTLPP